MRSRTVASVISLVLVFAALLAGSIMPASAQGYWNHRHYRHWYHRAPVIVAPIWSAPQPGWYWHSRAWYYNHPYGWRMAHPYHAGPHGGFYLQF